MTKKRNPQEYSPEEFDAVVAMIRADAELREDIEAIIGQSLEGKTARELFDAFRTIKRATELQLTVAAYGKARQLLRQTRADLAAGALEADVPEVPAAGEARLQIERLETKLDELKRENKQLRVSNKALMAGRRLPGAVPAVAEQEVS